MSAAVLTAGCSTDSGSDPGSGSAEPAASDSPAPAEPSADTSLQDALSVAGVNDALVADLGRVAGASGYGLQPDMPLTGDDAIRFAVVQLDTCRELASGFRTLEEVVARDVADGASRADAQAMADFLSSTYCPAVRSPEDSALPGPGAGSATPPADGTRGLMSPVDYLDATLPAGSLTECAAATGEPYGEPRAYTLPGGQLVCGSVNDTWDRHLIGFDVVFPQPVPVDQALPAIEALLPDDIGQPDTRPGENPSWSPIRGSCLSVAWSSPTIGAAVARLSTNFDDENAASAVLYSDRQTDEGASAPFDGTVRMASVGFGSHTEIESSINC
ncbi:hypothetical protein [Blastococcus montanus]|uniref:hypothetical protein n=1 Tax=Blastococcus montanus TaxID=3144973 RepID=UPI003208A44B